MLNNLCHTVLLLPILNGFFRGSFFILKPVLVDFGAMKAKRIGFVTEKDLSHIELDDMAAVHCPHSYNFLGNLFMISTNNITPLNLNSAGVMGYIVSGGITGITKRGICQISNKL